MSASANGSPRWDFRWNSQWRITGAQRAFKFAKASMYVVTIRSSQGGRRGTGTVTMFPGFSPDTLAMPESVPPVGGLWKTEES
ncbi:MAG: hypothetical protein ABSF71_01515 [Terriglobia bacterium]